MDIFAEAPLALLEVDRLSSDSSNLPTSLRDGVSNGHCGPLSSSSDLLDFDILCSGSLSDLILNFDDLVHSPLVAGTKPTKNGSDGERSLQDATLCDVKFWWKEALEDPCSLQYPLGEPPSGLGSYDDFESADVDGITEDGELDALRDGSVPLKSHLSGESVNSYRGQVTTDSDCSSTCVEHDTSGDTDSAALTTVDTCGESVSDLSPSHSKSHLRLIQFPVEDLKHHMDRLTANIMQLSDGLLELLATRDELLMLREASDDFIVLLNLVHQRRSRASRAALMATARARIRLRGFSRFRFPWSTKNVYTSNACSLSSLREDLVSSVRPGDISVCWRHNRAIPEFVNTGDFVALNSSDCVAAYQRSLNLQSKHRRPRTQPITYGPIDVRQQQYTFQNGASSKGQDPIDHRTTNGTDNNATQLNSEPTVSNDRARERLVALKDLCNNLAWPQGRPQMSQSLSLTLPVDVGPGDGITLAKLRVINRILHGTLLENPDTVQLIRAYTQAVQRKREVAKWVNGGANTALDLPDPGLRPGIPST